MSLPLQRTLRRILNQRLASRNDRQPPSHWNNLRQRGAIAVEAALALPILIGIGLIGADIQRIHTERIRLENAAGVMAINLAVQPELSLAGLDALADAAMQGHTDRQQLIILSVLQSGRIAWALQRGGADDLCEPQSAAGSYTGTLPEDPPEDSDATADDTDASTLSMVVVRACRDTSDIALSGGLVMPQVLDTTSIFRANSLNITLDEDLQAESDANGLAYSST
ncbi:pilus assembly protein [Corticibacter populi]|uniref:Pilus assembly protein n=1 Tax=Corticibacter populi TaxID=1550736 RepID=A0A3M6QV12_9BURK|nr:pilus assembly protein [Corticibacter populi]RMX06855.1 pilus assembly protein [Corticibacter populi]RZS31554.1 putative Flp pilus-assembly TadE/G-like protein [Corticibacter populi]